MPPCRTHAVAWCLLLLASLAAGRAAAQTAQSPEQPAFRTATDIIPVDVVILDGKGRQVADLDAAAFTVTIDGRPRRIASARYIRHASTEPPPAPPAPGGAARPSGFPRISSNQEPPGRFVMVVVDEPGMTFGGTRVALEGVKRLLATLNPRDAVGLSALPNRGVAVPFTREHARVLETLARIGGGSSGYQPFTKQQVGWAEALEYKRSSNGLLWRAIIKRECSYCTDAACLNLCTATLEGEASMMLGAMRERVGMFSTGMRGLLSYLRTIDAPKTLILLSSGAVADPLDNEFDSLGRDAADSRCSIYALHFRASEIPDASERGISPSRADDVALARTPLDLLAGRTRGTVFDIFGSTSFAFEGIAVELAGYYLLAVEPEASDRDGRTHRISVAVPGRSVTVRARRELVWKEPAPKVRSSVDAVRAMLASPVTVNDLPLRVVSYTGPAPEGGKLRVMISAEVGRESTGPEELTVGWTLAAPNGRLAGSFNGKVRLDPVGGRAGAPLSFVVTPLVDAGQYAFKLALMDSRGRGGSVTHDLTAALRSAGPLAVGDLVVGIPPAGKDANFQPPVECVVDGDRLFVYLPVTSPEPRTLAGTRATVEITTGEEDRALLQSPARLTGTKADQRAVQVSVPLGLLPPGSYVARVQLSAAGALVATASREFLFAPAPIAARAAGTPAPGPGGSPFAAPALTLREILEAPALAPFLDRAAKAGPDLPPEVFSDARAGRLDEAVRRLPADSPGPAAPFIRGLALLQHTDLEAAAQAFRESRRLSPEFADAAVFLGVCFIAGGRDEEAVGALQTARFGLDSEPMVHHLLIDARLRRRQVEPARALAEAAARRWPDDGVFQRQLATVLAAAGDAPRALTVLDAHLARHADDPQALFLALRLLYESAVAAKGKPAAGLVQRFRGYAALYEAAAGPERALVAAWLKYLTR